MSTTVRNIIEASMRKIGVLAGGDKISSSEGKDAKNTLRQMVDDWSNESLMIPVNTVVTKTLLAGIAEYTIGKFSEPVPVPLPDNHIDTSRPQEYVAAFIRDSYQTDYVQEFIDVKTYSRISRKTNESRPSRIFIRQGWPLDTILFESVPYADETLHLELLQPLSEILVTANLSDVVNLPPGYEKALIFNLAIDLADEWGKSPSQTIAINAVNGKRFIKRKNSRDLVQGMDRALGNHRRAKGTYIIEQGP